MIVGPVDLKAIGGASGGFPPGMPSPRRRQPAVSFASVLSDMATDTVGTLQRAEQVSVQGCRARSTRARWSTR